MYLNGDGVPQSDAEALKWYRKAAEHGYAPGQYALGWMYERGRSLSEDVAEAVKWMRLAASQEYPAAEAHLSWLYLNGRGLPQDNGEAVKLARRAAEKDNAWGQQLLGWLYLTGRGVPEDRDEAVRWLRKAAEQGDDWSLEAMGELDRRLQAEIKERLRRKEESDEKQRAEIAERFRRQATRQALRAAGDSGADGASALRRPAHELLAEALEDLAWVVTAKVAADVEAVARAFWETRASTEGQDQLHQLLAPLELMKSASTRIGNAEEEDALRAALEGAESSLEFSTMLACLPYYQGGKGEASVPIHLGRVRKMLEVGNLYTAQEDYVAAMRLYLLGFDNLASPIRAAAPVTAGDRQDSGVWHVADLLREELRGLAQEILNSSPEPQPRKELGPVIVRVASLAAQVEAASGANPPISALTAAEMDGGSQLGAVAALDTVRQELAKLAPEQGRDVVRMVDAESGGQRVNWTVAYQSPAGGLAGEVHRSVVTSGSLSLPSLSDRFSADASTAPLRLAYEMLVTLPVEIANLSREVGDVAAAARAAAGVDEDISFSTNPSVEASKRE